MFPPSGTLGPPMSTEKVASIPTVDHKPHAAFFRQSGWLMMANIISGILTLGVHFLSKRIPEAQYSIFGTMLMVTACIPTIPLQMVYAQQTAQSLVTNRERQLAGMIRLGWLWTFIIWAIAATVICFYQAQIVQEWKLPGAHILYVTLAAVLMNLWMPLFAGVLQGRQDFFWLGWGTIANGAGRAFIAIFLVLAFGSGATGMVLGAVAGIGAWAFIGMWRSRDLWTVKPEKFDGSALLRQVVPLFLGFGACQFLFTTDTIYCMAFFSNDEMAPYVAAGTLSRALLWLVLPLAAVMFPKIVHATAKSEKTNLLGIVLLGTGTLAICCTAGLCLVGPLAVKIVFKSAYVNETTALLPWYAGAMIPLALGNVLVNDLLARGKFKIVVPMVLLALAYGFTLPAVLHRYYGHLTDVKVMEMALQVLGGFNLLLLASAVWFSFFHPKAKA
jgi:O-antigen/teichoic acid export membrane protein